jgi:hypothetical protein
MRIFLDTEFTELTQQAQLISIGLAAENGDWFYAELTDYDPSSIGPWVKDNVLTLLTGAELANAQLVHIEANMSCQGNAIEVSQALHGWLKRFGEKDCIHIWADVLAWDWVLFCELFGGAFSIPEQVFWIPFDLSTLLLTKGLDPNTTRETLGQVDLQVPKLKLAKHHALYDAWLEKVIFEGLST